MTERAYPKAQPLASVQRWGAWPAWVMLTVFFVAPLGALVVEAAQGGVHTWTGVFADPLFLPAARNSLLLAVSAASLSTIIGVVLAIELTRRPRRQREWMLVLLGLPLAFSGLVIAYGFILAFGRAGVVTQVFAVMGADAAEVGAWIYSAPGLAFAYAYYLIPRVALTLYPVFANLDSRAIEAARTLGAPTWRAFCDVTLPEVAPSIFAAWCLVAAIALGTYGTALALAGTQINILPLLLFVKIGDGGADFAGAAALSLLLLGFCSIFLGCGDVFGRKRERSVVASHA